MDAARMPDPAPPPDARTAGDGDAFEALFRAEYGRVVGIARRVLRDPDEAADVAQEVFLAALRGRVALRPRAGGWLHAAAAHTALNHLRAARRLGERQARAVRAGAGRDGDGAPDRLLEASEERRLVRRLLARMPERQAAILVLRHSGLSYAEVAVALGLKPGSVGTLLRRAELAMRKEWETYASD